MNSMNNYMHRTLWLGNWRVSRASGRPWKTGRTSWAIYTLRFIIFLPETISAFIIWFSNIDASYRRVKLRVYSFISYRWGLRNTWRWEELIAGQDLSSSLLLLSGFVSMCSSFTINVIAVFFTEWFGSYHGINAVENPWRASFKFAWKGIHTT